MVPTVLVGHSFSGMIVTEAGVHPSVSALVYVVHGPGVVRITQRWRKHFRHRRGFPASCSTATKDVSAKPRSCAISQVTAENKGEDPYAVQEPFQKAL